MTDKKALNKFERELEEKLKVLCKKFKFDWNLFEKAYKKNVFGILVKAFLHGKDGARRDFFNDLTDKIKKALSLLGWKGGCCCDLWKDDNKVWIGFNIQSKKKKPSKKVMNQIKELFDFDEIDYLEDGHSMVLGKELSKK